MELKQGCHAKNRRFTYIDGELVLIPLEHEVSVEKMSEDELQEKINNHELKIDFVTIAGKPVRCLMGCGYIKATARTGKALDAAKKKLADRMKELGLG